MPDSRRIFLRTLAGLAVLSGFPPLARELAAAAPLVPGSPLRQALREALGGAEWERSGAILLEVPAVAENGAIVPITVESRLEDTRQILIFGEKNPGPLLARFRFEPGTDPWVSLRVKLNESGRVLALAEAGSRWYGTEQPVRVMLGGCG